MDLSHPHDTFFKSWFAEPGHLTDLLKVVLPEALFDQLDWATLAVQDGTYIDEEHKEHFSDLVATVQMPGRGNASGPSPKQSVQLYFLIEHKSYNDHGALLQLLRYMVNTWARDARQAPQAKLTPIVPILFYHGDSPRIVTQFPALFAAELPEAVQAYLPSFRCEVLNLTSTDIPGLSVSPETEAALWAMKFSRTQVKLVLEAFDRLVKTLGQAFVKSPDFKSLQLYLVASSTLTVSELLDYVNTWITDAFLKEKIMTTAQALIQEGEARGREAGIREGAARGREAERQSMAKKLLALGLSVEQIAQTTGLISAEIKTLKHS